MKDEILSRRAFFHKAIQKTLPVLMGTSALFSFASCVADDEELLKALAKEDGGGGVTNNDTDNKAEVSSASGKIDGYEYVDLGLSVKWARYNIGASKPESYGAYLYSHTLCSDSNCYDKLLNAGFWHDNKSTSGTRYDMAMSKWSNKWRMPTRDDFEELINNCTVSYIKYNNCNGYLFKSKKNGKSIFLAAAGGKWRWRGVWEDVNVGSWGLYWSGDIYISASYNPSYNLRCVQNNAKIYDDDMFDNKFTIRPVSNNEGTSSGCNGTCTATCANNANGGCTGCSINCSSGCKNSCNYICSSTCSNNCYGRCSTSCGGKCTYVSAGSGCSGCASSCYNQCYTSCVHACYGACMSQCISSSK